MKAPQTAAHNQVPEDVELTLSELREMASRQQLQIDDHQQQLVAKEQRLRYLKQQENRHQTMNSEADRLRRLRERVEAQEMKLRKLRSLRGQSEQQRVTNTALIVDLENIRALFNEKEKELSVAVARVEEMSRQLEEVKRGRQLRHGSHGETHLELEKLRRELMYRNRLNEQQQNQLIGQRQLIGQKRDEMVRVDQRIAELQQRLHRKRAHNQQLAAQVQSVSAAKRPVRQNNAVADPNAPAHAPFTAPSKSDPKYQTLPHNTKFSVRPPQSDPAKAPVAPPAGHQDNHRVRAPPLGAANGQTVSSGVRVTSSLPRPVQSVSSLQSVQPPSSGNTTDHNIANNNNNNGSSNGNTKSNNHNTAAALQLTSETSECRPFLPPKPGNQWRPGDAEHTIAAVSNSEETAQIHRLVRSQPTPTVTDSDDSTDPADRVNANRPDLTVSDEPDRVAVGRLHARTASLPADVAPPVGKTPLPTTADTTSPPSQQQQPSGSAADTDAVFVDGDESRCERRRKPSNLRHPGSSSSSSLLRIRRVSFDPLALLLDASLEGELELVKKTAVEVVDPSASNDEGITALHNAICAGHLEIVQFLVEFGCDVNAQDSDGWTPLHCAASCNNLPMVRFLVEHGACIFASTLSDQETAAEKCEEDEEGYHGCSEYLYSIQEKLGILNSGRVYALFPYSSQNADELPLADGQPLTVLRKGDEVERDWWWARAVDATDNPDGYIPRNLLGLYPRVGPRAGVTEPLSSE